MLGAYDWFIINTALMLMYGLQHTLLTTKTAVNAFNKVMPAAGCGTSATACSPSCCW